MVTKEITQRFLSLRNTQEAQRLAKFFKTGDGEYGYGDKFLGIKVPTTRAIVKGNRDIIEVEDCIILIQSEWHEIRLAGFLLFIEPYRKAKKQNDFSKAKQIVNVYIKHIPYGNNWDLVDLVCEFILGDWLIINQQERHILDKFADMENSLWHQRVAIVSTFSLIRAGQYSDTIRISKKFLNHKHDLINKATGWMLREMGKRGGYDQLISFLDKYATSMSRTALRYSIERLPEDLRQHYLKK